MTPPFIRAMILAAGRGERMRPLTDHTPKPLLPVRGKPLMQWPLEALSQGGFDGVVVNTAWLGEQISAEFGSLLALQPPSIKRDQLLNSEQLVSRPIHLSYSHEGLDFGGALETAGGIARALPLLCAPDATGGSPDVFWVLAGDVFAPEFQFTATAVERFTASGKLAHLWLVPNPAHNPGGDFGLSADGLALNLPAGSAPATPRYTYSTIGLYHRALFALPYCAIPAGNPEGVKAALAPLLRAAMDQGQVSAEIYTGEWTDVGTPERLKALEQPAA